MKIDIWVIIYAIVFGGNLLAALIFTPLARKRSLATGFMDTPKSEAHKQQSSAVALGGGYAMMLALMSCILLGMAGYLLHLPEKLGIAESLNFNPFQIKYLSLLFAAFAATLLGFIDDRHALSAPIKFGGQFLVALIAVWPGEARLSLFIPSPLIVTVISIFWFMLLMNAINFFDNMDGLATGTIAIAMGFFLFTAALNQQFLVAVMAAAVMGCSIGFWWYNKAPAKIYMGDSGSHLLGFLAALVSVCVTYFRPDSASYFPIFMPLLILALPLTDAATVCVIRAKMGKPFWIGDHNHISHRFVKMGLSRPQAVLCVHLLSIIFGLAALPLLWSGLRTTVVILLQGAVLITFILYIQHEAKK